MNRLISQTNEDGATVSLSRNGTDDIVGYNDARGLATTYVRNGFGEVIQEQSPDRGVTTYMRDARGLVTQKTDARGVVSNYQYDAQGRLTGKTFPAYSNYWEGFDWDVQNNGANVGLGVSLRRDARAGPGCLNSFPRTISAFPPGSFVRWRRGVGGDAGRA